MKDGKDVLITILGKQDYEGEQDEIEMVTIGRMEQTETGIFLRYEEQNEDNHRSVTTTITITNEIITLERAGTANSRMMIEQGQRHMCYYDTGFGQLMIGVFGEMVESDFDHTCGSLYMKYTIDINSVLASCNEVTISVKPA